MSKSYWQTISVRTDRDRAAVKSWFAGMCDDMTPESAEVLCDKETDREKKLRAVMVDKDGKRKLVTRTRGKNFTITIAPATP